MELPMEVQARPEPERGADDRWLWQFIRSYLYLRLAVGVLGIALPALLIAVVDLFEGDNPATRGSFSAYYYTGARDVFVASLSVMGVFLIGYKLSARVPGSDQLTVENWVTSAAGVAAIMVAFFPTHPPTGVEETPLQSFFGAEATGTIHYIAAVVFIALLAFISLYFGEAEGPRSKRPAAMQAAQRWSPTRWMWFHRSLAAVMIAAMAAFGLNELFGGPDRYALFITELVCTFAFSVSWIAKGMEWNVLRRHAGDKVSGGSASG